MPRLAMTTWGFIPHGWSSNGMMLTTHFHPVPWPRISGDIPYILESNLHPFYSFRGLKNQMRIRIACGLDSRSRAGFWKNDSRCMCHKNNTIIYYFIYYLYYIIYCIYNYYSSDSPSSLITESLSITQPLSSLFSPSPSYRMSSSDPSKALLMQHFLKDLTIMFSGTAFHAADTQRATSEGAACKGRLKERCRLEQRNNFFSFKKSAKTSVD